MVVLAVLHQYAGVVIAGPCRETITLCAPLYIYNSFRTITITIGITFTIGSTFAAKSDYARLLLLVQRALFLREGDDFLLYRKPLAASDHLDDPL